MSGISLKRYAAALDVKPGPFRRKFWIWDDQVYFDRYALVGADAKTFRFINETWGCDQRHIYCEYSRVRDADVATFYALNPLFAVDKKYVHTPLGICVDADPESFEALDRGKTKTDDGPSYVCGYGRDEKAVYYVDTSSRKPRLLRGADRDTFRVLKYGFAVDAKKVFLQGARIPKADPQTLKILNRNYCIDANRAFYATREVEGADLKTFRAVKGCDAKDKRHNYTFGFRK